MYPGGLIFRWVKPIHQSQIGADVEHHARKQDAVIDELRPAPLHGTKPGTHGLSPSVACGACTSGGGRSASAMAKPNATAKARMGQSARLIDRCDRVIGRISANG